MVRAIEAQPGGKREAKLPMLMELVGPAAGGKTTLSTALNSLNGTFVPGDDISLRRIKYLPLFVRNALRLRPLLLARSPATRRFTWDEIKSMVYLQAWSRVLGRQGADAGAIVLVDQGPIFRLATLHEFAPETLRSPVAESWWRERFTEWAAILYRVIWLDAPDTILQERINARNRWHLVKGKSESEVHEFLVRYRRSYQYVLEKLAVNSEPKLLCFDTSRQSVQDILEKILAAHDATSVAD
jgi:shikimate kinase